MDNTVKVAIIGAGSIGAMKPDKYDSPKTKNILTHAHAVHSLGAKAKLVAIIEKEQTKGIEAAKKWGTYWYQDLKYMKEYADIIIVAVSTENHYEILHQIANLPDKPRIVIAEKPFCKNLKEAQTISKLFKRKGIKIVVDYARRFSADMSDFRNDIIKEVYGEIQSCKITYTRGLIRDACHGIDLCNYLFGKCKEATLLGEISSGYIDYSKSDPTLPAYLRYEKCKNVFLNPVNGEKYDVFEVDIWTDVGRVIFIKHGLKKIFFPVTTEEVYGDYKTIADKPSSIEETELSFFLKYILTHSINILNGETEDYICTDTDAIKVHKIFEKLGVTDDRISN